MTVADSAVTGGVGPGALVLVLATANPDKAREIEAIVSEAAGAAIELRPRPASVPEVDETGATLEDNARLKARALTEATGLAAVADDTGLEVEALGGVPGVHSARFAGPDASYADNVAKLLGALDAAGAGDPAARRARFRTVAVARFPDGTEVVGYGEIEGYIAEAARGGGGFGYDPVFVPDGGGGSSYAEMSLSEKAALSHRGAAFRSLAASLLARSAG